MIDGEENGNRLIFKHLVFWKQLESFKIWILLARDPLGVLRGSWWNSKLTFFEVITSHRIRNDYLKTGRKVFLNFYRQNKFMSKSNRRNSASIIIISSKFHVIQKLKYLRNIFLHTFMIPPQKRATEIN